jgi:hypothetical protein
MLWLRPGMTGAAGVHIYGRCHEPPDSDLEPRMNEDVLNTSVRKFLKTVGVTSQREIEMAVRNAVASGRLKGNETLPAKMKLTVGGIDLSYEIDGTVELQ